MNFLARLVADRYARRTIQFDHQTIALQGAKLAEEALEKIVKAAWPNIPLDDQVDPFEIYASKTLRMKDVRGLGKNIKVVLRGRPSGNSRPTSGGDFNSSYGIINLYLNSSWTPEALVTSKNLIIRKISSYLVHEVTHALDVFGGLDSYVGGGGDPEVYFNQPQEFRAYAKQIVTESLASVPKLKRLKYLGKLPPLSKFIEDLLEDSKTFEQIGENFNRSNQNRLRQMLVREVQDSGLL